MKSLVASLGDIHKNKVNHSIPYIRENSLKFHVSPKIQLSLTYNLANMTLSVVVHSICNLRETSVTWIPSARVVTRVIEISDNSQFRRLSNTQRKTKTQRHTVNPVFEETFDYFIPVCNLRKRWVEIRVHNNSGFPGRWIGRNVVLGRCIVSHLGYVLHCF